jgi:hypothetical protein
MLEGLFGHILANVADRLLGWAIQPRWLIQWRLKAATGKKIAILVAKIDGDDSTDRIREEIIDSIKRELGSSVEPYRWPHVLATKPGSHEFVENEVHRSARRWLKRKHCDLLVAGRIKANNVVSLALGAVRRGGSRDPFRIGYFRNSNSSQRSRETDPI